MSAQIRKVKEMGKRPGVVRMHYKHSPAGQAKMAQGAPYATFATIARRITVRAKNKYMLAAGNPTSKYTHPKLPMGGRSGALRDSVTTRSIRAGTLNVPFGHTITADTPYALAQHEGRFDRPARPYLREAMREILKESGLWNV